MQNKNTIRIALGAAFILMLPLLAMQFTDEVNWDLFDFAVAATLLLGTGFLYELITRKVGAKYRVAVAIVLAAALLLVWAELAVGVFGTPFSGQ